MNGASFRPVMSAPMTSPASAPVRMPPRAATDGGRCASCMSSATATVTSADHRTDGQVDAAADDDQGHAEAGGRHDGALAQHDLDVLPRRKRAPAEGGEEAEDEQQADERAEAGQDGPPVEAAVARPAARGGEFGRVQNRTGRGWS